MSGSRAGTRRQHRVTTYLSVIGGARSSRCNKTYKGGYADNCSAVRRDARAHSHGLALVAGRLRGQKNISVGDGGDKDLLLAMRQQANFVEYVPIALILIGLLELNHVRDAAIHALGATLVMARLCHAFGIRADRRVPSATFTSAIPTRPIGALSSEAPDPLSSPSTPLMGDRRCMVEDRESSVVANPSHACKERRAN